VELIAAGNVPRAWARADTRSSFWTWTPQNLVSCATHITRARHLRNTVECFHRRFH
jgi:hypothetical protein